MTRKKGGFITLEGIDASGKSTQQKLLCERLDAEGCESLATREPEGTAKGRDLWGLLQKTGWTPEAEVFLYAAARRQHVQEVIAPALKRGAFVVCDRFIDSTLAYQGYGQGVQHDVIERVNADATGGLLPDVTFICDIEPKTALARIEAREKDKSRYEAMEMAFHTSVREGFLEIARGAPERCVIIGASASSDKIAAHVWAAVHARLGARMERTS